MPRPTPQFKAHVALTFEEHNETRRNWFEFGEDGHRRVRMSMESVEGLHTVGLWISGAARFHKGDAFDAECIVIWREGFTSAVVPGRTFKLWDGGFFANGTVTERIEEGWPKPATQNKESWAFVVRDNNEYPDTEHWNNWRSAITPLLNQCMAAGYNGLFRAGKSMHHILLSTLDHKGLRGEPHVTLVVTEDGKIGIHYSRANIYFGPSIQSEVVPSSGAFPILTRYLQHLWTETVTEPIPPELRQKNS
jgi:hypothetical protein